MDWFSSLRFLFLFSPFLTSSNVSSSSIIHHPSPLCHPYERSALLQFNNSFADINFNIYSCVGIDPVTVSWAKNDTSDCCAWRGVTCDEKSGHVIGLDLSCARLSGAFQSNSTLFFLRHLQNLDLSYNNFGGSTIPSEFGKFANLEHLKMSFCNFLGHVPPEISYLSKLVTLDLSYNIQELRVDTSTLNRIVTNLTNLEVFNMDLVDMSSVSPVVMMNLSSSLVNLSLSNCSLRGNLPADYIFHLPKLEMLNLDGNENLTAPLLPPKSNWSSTSPVLTYLDLSRTKLSIDLPSLIQNFKSLESLFLSSCRILGWNNTPTLLSNLTEISRLYLSSNNLGGEIPWSSLIHLKRLESLYLSDNNFIGQLPEISNLTQIRRLDLSSNNLGGEIPWSSLMHLKSLKLLDLSGNNFIGQLPDEISFSSNNYSSNNILTPAADSFLLELESLSLSDNSLNGTIPGWLYSLKFLKGLKLQNNQFTSFSNDDFQSHSLTYLDLSNNKLHGSIPTSICQLVNLYILNLSSNNLTGDVGLYNFSKLTSLYFLSISNNQLSGEIPSSICNLNFLQVLDLSNNSLNGTIHPCLVNFGVWFSVLNLGMNKLHGTIPDTFAAYGNLLRSLNLNGNQLGGLLPQSLLNSEWLEILDVGNNKINDTFPYRLESLPYLQVLILRSNSFHGSIEYSSKTSPPFQTLRIMDLSDNEFNGNLPTEYFENFVAMMDQHTEQLEYMGDAYYQDSVILVMKGFFVEFVKIQTIFTTNDLSKNKFEGEIPRLIGKLKALKGLNISHNKLTGSIPSTLGNLSNLEWLDLSSNELVGEIPQQLTNMISLSVLNLSRNRLVGTIPHGKQFDTFENNSYSENLGLCGFPLSKMCGNNNEAPQSPSPNFQEEGGWKETYGLEWKIILMGYGCGIVIGISLGYIVLYNEKVTLFLIRIGFSKLLYA